MNHILLLNRKAIAMIELIFAIVVMGIVMMSAPMLIQTSSQSSYVALQQESIAAAASQIGMILSSEWDELDTNSTIGEPVLRTASTTFGQCSGAQVHPVGVTSSSGRYCRGLNGSFGHTASSTLGVDLGDYIYDDVDDYNNQVVNVKIYNGESILTEQGDYIDQDVAITTYVYYGNDLLTASTTTQKTFNNPFQTTFGTSTNLKLISVVLNSTNSATELSSDKTIRLSAFVCNIGAPSPTIISNESEL